MAYSRKNSMRRKAPKRTFKRKSYAKKVTKPIKMAIRREIARNTENKTAQYYNYNVRLYTPGNANFPIDNIFPLGPDPGSLVINQGTGQGQRIGNEIKTKKLIFKGTVCPQPWITTFNPTPQPVQLKMWIFYDKSQPTEVPNPIAGNDFFQNGSVVKSFANDLVDMWSPVNTDRYRVLASKTFKIGNAMSSGTGPAPDSQFFANNDFKLNANFSFDLTKHYPQRVKFSDNTSTPTTRGLFCMCEYVLASGQVLGTVPYMLQLQYMLDYQYEDA